MGAKDLTQRTLEGYNDVFADIANVLVFGGESVVGEGELRDAAARSIYKTAGGSVRGQERDVAKFWNGSEIRMALFGLENQTEVDADMPLRVISYDGAAYRQQLRDGKERYPVITLVLYFGERPWNAGRTLHERIEVPDGLRPFVSDYKVNVCEISQLTREQVGQFRSDFRIVADYFVQVRERGCYAPGEDVPRHAQEVLDLLSALTGDPRFEEAYHDVPEEEREGRTMSKYLDMLIDEGKEKGKEEGKAEGKAEGLTQSIRNLMQTMKWSVEEAMDKLLIAESEREQFRKMISG